MRDQTNALAPRDGVLILSGYGLRLSVHHGRLSVSDNLNGVRRHSELSRATSRLRRLVVLGHTGFVTLDALRWLHDVGASFVQIDADGKLVACFAPQSVNDVTVRRAQLMATLTVEGLAIAARLIADKLQAQSDLLTKRRLLEPLALRPIIDARDHALRARTPDELLWYEATGATVYWNALAALPVRFVRSDLPRVPAHWLTFGPRHSPLTDQPLNAITPASAMINYGLALLEAEMRTALLARGLDPEIGLLHALRRGRSSLALDAIEPLRPLVDEFVLEILATRVLSSHDFHETYRGVCRLSPNVARIMVSNAHRWGPRVGPVVDALVRAFQQSDKGGALRNPGASRLRGQLHRRTAGGGGRPPQVSLDPRCAECGAAMSRARYDRCSACEQRRRTLQAPQLKGAEVLRRMREAGVDPAHGGAAQKKRSAIASQRHAEATATSGRERVTPEERARFREQVLPLLAQSSVGALSRATSLSKTYCSFIKRGLRTPHPRHWDALRALVPTAHSPGPEWRRNLPSA